jgi:hypothetical protein
MATPHPISLSKIGERVKRLLSAGKDLVENRVTQRDAELAVAEARDESIVEYLGQLKAAGEPAMPFDFISEKTVTAEKSGNLHKATLPTRPLSIGGKASGIFTVVFEEDPSHEIFPTTISHNTMFKGQPAENMESDAYYTPFEDTLRIWGLETDSCNIIVQYVQVGEQFDADEYFAVPPELIDTIVAKAVKMLSMQLSQEDPFTDAKNP